MQKVKHNLEIDTGLINLPSIRKATSNSANSPIEMYKYKQVLNSPILECTEYSDSSSRQQSEELYLNKNEFISTPKERKAISLKSNTEQLLKKIQNLERLNKTLEEELKNSKINDEIKQSNEFMYETVSSLNKKSAALRYIEKSESIEFIRDGSKRNRYKETELLNSKKKNEEYQGYIDNLLKENSYLKIKNSKLQENIDKITQSLNETENSIKGYQNNLKTCEARLLEKVNELKFKQIELTEMNEILKKSEEKRKTVNEYSSSIEYRLQKFQNKLYNLQQSNANLQKELQEINNKLQLKETTIADLLKKVSGLESMIDSEKEKYFIDLTDFEKQKENLETAIEQKVLKIEKLEMENNRLLENLTKSQSDLQPNSPQRIYCRRSEANLDSKIVSDIIKEESTRWQLRFTQSEKELFIIKEESEKYKKDNIYLKNQIISKDALIEQLEILIRSSDKNANSIEITPISYHLAHIGDIISITDNIINTSKDIEEFLKCNICFRIPTNFIICLPCSHICCSYCKFSVESVCMKCAQKVTETIPAIYFDKISEYYSNIIYDLGNMKKLLNYQQFN